MRIGKFYCDNQISKISTNSQKMRIDAVEYGTRKHIQ